MKFRKDGQNYWVILDTGDEIIASLSEFAKKEKILGAQLWGIGSIKDCELGDFDYAKNEYARRKFPGGHELLSLTGNINDSGVHAHVLVGGKDFAPVGGHLFSGTVPLVCEIFVIPSRALKKSPLGIGQLKKIDLDAD